MSSLEDPRSIEGLPPVPSAAGPQRRALRDVSLPDLGAFKGYFKLKQRKLIDDDPDAPWHERLVIRCAHLSQGPLRNVALSLAGLCVFVICAVTVRYLLGYDAVVPVFVASDLRALHAPESPLAYAWLDGRADNNVGSHVTSARAKLGINAAAAARLVLVGANVDDSAPARNIACDAQSARDFAHRQAYVDLMSRAEQFLAEAKDGASCVCAAQLGSSVNYIAFRSEALGEQVMHMFNPTDSSLEPFEQLDAERLAQLGVPLTRSTANQDYRYNKARGSYVVLRRLELSIVGVDAMCVRQRITVKQRSALQAEECLDLLRGIDVRDRARRQWQRGVLLNADQFASKDL